MIMSLAMAVGVIVGVGVFGGGGGVGVFGSGVGGIGVIVGVEVIVGVDVMVGVGEGGGVKVGVGVGAKERLNLTAVTSSPGTVEVKVVVPDAQSSDLPMISTAPVMLPKNPRAARSRVMVTDCWVEDLFHSVTTIVSLPLPMKLKALKSERLFVRPRSALNVP